jgi:hypothetical protein
MQPWILVCKRIYPYASASHIFFCDLLKVIIRLVLSVFLLRSFDVLIGINKRGFLLGGGLCVCIWGFSLSLSPSPSLRVSSLVKKSEAKERGTRIEDAKADKKTYLFQFRHTILPGLRSKNNKSKVVSLPTEIVYSAGLPVSSATAPSSFGSAGAAAGCSAGSASEEVQSVWEGKG